MSNPNGEKGARFEKAIADRLQLDLPYLEISRARKRGSDDTGDIAGLPWIVIEAKDRSPYDIPGALRQAKIAAGKKGVQDYVVVVKLRNRNIDEAIFIMPLGQGSRWLAERDASMRSESQQNFPDKK